MIFAFNKLHVKMFRDNWVNAQEQQRLYPDTFEAPDHNDLNAIQVGDYVKISNGKERFWTVVIDMKEDDIIARVDNKLVATQRYTVNDIVVFKKENIYNILRY
jgi:hypothetical protein